MDQSPARYRVAYKFRQPFTPTVNYSCQLTSQPNLWTVKQTPNRPPGF